MWDYQRNAISRFIHDIPEQLTNRVGVEMSFVEPARPSDFGEAPKPKVRLTAEKRFKDGDSVRHATFGEGIVVERRGDLITIAFKDKKTGIKKFAANIAPLEKV